MYSRWQDVHLSVSSERTVLPCAIAYDHRGQIAHKTGTVHRICQLRALIKFEFLKTKYNNFCKIPSFVALFYQRCIAITCLVQRTQKELLKPNGVHDRENPFRGRGAILSCSPRGQNCPCMFFKGVLWLRTLYAWIERRLNYGRTFQFAHRSICCPAMW